MQVKIIQSDGTQKICSCGHSIFRSSARSRVLYREKIKDCGNYSHFKEIGEYYNLRICNKCNAREKFNTLTWTRINRGG